MGLTISPHSHTPSLIYLSTPLGVQPWRKILRISALRAYVLKPTETGTILCCLTADLQARSTEFKMAEEELLIGQYNVLNYPSYTANLALFSNVTNSNELRQLIVQGKLEAALLNASMVLLSLVYMLYI